MSKVIYICICIKPEINVLAIHTKNQISFALISVSTGYIYIGKQKWKLHSDTTSELIWMYNDM